MIYLFLWSGKVLFLLVLYAFIFMLVRAAVRDMRRADSAQSVSSSVSPSPQGVDLNRSPRGWSDSRRLRVKSSPCFPAGQEVLLPGKGRMLLGRGAEADVQFDDTFVSSRHASIESEGEELVLRDLGSTNGTVLNGVEITGPELLKAGDLVEVGDTVFIVEVG